MTLAAFALALLVAVPADTNDTYARAESLLVAGRLKEARALVQQLLRENADDARALTLFGRVYLEWPVVGRWKAWQLLERAAELEPRNPEPRYWQARVGRRLGGADGERMVRDALYAIWEIDPTYRDTWEMWQRLYRNADHRRRAIVLFGRHAGDPILDLRRVELLIEIGASGEADSLLAAVIAAGRDDAAVWALRAQAALEAQDTTKGMAYYDEALDRAASDSAEILWRQIEPIATPEELRAYRTTAAVDRTAFFRTFWTRREPDLTTRLNERIVEHFQRLQYARHRFQLRNPMGAFHRSELWRTLQGELAPTVVATMHELAPPGSGVIPGRSRFEDEIQEAGLGVDVRDLPEPDSLTRYGYFGLDGRGLIYLRYGQPKRLYLSSPSAPARVEAWHYVIDGEPVTLTLAHTSGDMVLYPTSRRELHNSTMMLERDATSMHADLPVQVWVASFRSVVRLRQEVYVKATPDGGSAVAWDHTWNEVVRGGGLGPLQFTLPAGPYYLGMDVRAGDRLGSLRDSMVVPEYWLDRLALSSILVGLVPHADFDRDDVARGMPGNLQLPAGAPLALYGEIYNLPADSAGFAEFEVEYAFQPEGSGRRGTFAFTRRVLAAPTVVERMVIEPGEIRPGRYRIVMTVRDRIYGREAQTTRVNLELR